MAEAVRRHFGTDYGVGITGVAGPDPMGGVAPGTVHVAITGPSGFLHGSSMTFNQGRAMVKRRAVTSALQLLRRALIEAPSS